MVVMKMTHMKSLPETCDDCTYYGCRPHPYKGWSQSCELCMHCMDDDQPEEWIYDGDGRPKACPLFEVKESVDVLDKIRAEIMKLQTYKMFEGEDTVYVEHEDVLAIIDKYKSESEDKTE